MLVKFQIKIVTIIPRIAQYRNRLPTPNISAKGPDSKVPIGEIDMDSEESMEVIRPILSVGTTVCINV